MPIYEYRCDACGEQMEKLKRLVSAAAFRLKGAGWYETDFKKDNKRNLADSTATTATSDSSASSNNGKGSGGTAAGDKVKKTDSKPVKTTAKSDSA